MFLIIHLNIGILSGENTYWLLPSVRVGLHFPSRTTALIAYTHELYFFLSIGCSYTVHLNIAPVP